MSKTKILALVLAVAVLCGLTAGCKKGGKPEEPAEYTALPTALTATKIGSIDRLEFTTTDGGLYYRDKDGKYGIMTHNGKKDTGPIYTFCKPLESYFLVADVVPSFTAKPKELNVNGLVDATGKELIPKEYASIDLMDDRFARVCQAVAVTTSEEKQMLHYNTVEGKKMLTGVWYVYDMQEGKRVPGATGTTRYAAYTYGEYVKYVTDDKQIIVAHPDGTPLPEKAIHLKNGCYALEDAKGGTVYDGTGKKLFTYKKDGWIPYDSTDLEGDIIAKKKVGDTEQYVILNRKGEVISGVFTFEPDLAGGKLYVDGKLYQWNGKKVFDTPCKSIQTEPLTGQCWMLETLDDKDVLVCNNGKVLYRENEEKYGKVTFDSDRFLLSKEEEDRTLFYSMKKKKFVLEGESFAPWLIKMEQEDSKNSLIDTISGKVLLKDYFRYRYSDKNGELLYVYAETEEDTWDIYVVK